MAHFDDFRARGLPEDLLDVNDFTDFRLRPLEGLEGKPVTLVSISEGCRDPKEFTGRIPEGKVASTARLIISWCGDNGVVASFVFLLTSLEISEDKNSFTK
mmetsp:Transcript_9346/g.15237  ORF Transcript_9346/g.15237 Transcript_9346/m.15237 type:complete len:101 (-) Transcript_9346:2451-2753(-)